MTNMKRVITQEAALRTAFASSRMEGLEVTPEVESNCRRLLDGEISVAELVQEIIEKHAAGNKVE